MTKDKDNPTVSGINEYDTAALLISFNDVNY